METTKQDPRCEMNERLKEIRDRISQLMGEQAEILEQKRQELISRLPICFTCKCRGEACFSSSYATESILSVFKEFFDAQKAEAHQRISQGYSNSNNLCFYHWSPQDPACRKCLHERSCCKETWIMWALIRMRISEDEDFLERIAPNPSDARMI